MDSTPSVTLLSENRGSTELIPDTSNLSTERPHSSADGKYLVYERTDASGVQQIYFVDMFTGAAPVLISRTFASANVGGNSNSYRPRISSDGSTVVFHSQANDLVLGDVNDHEDVFIYSISKGHLTRAYDQSVNDEPNNGSFYPDVNGDGTRIVFESEATNLQSNGVSTSGRQIFLLGSIEWGFHGQSIDARKRTQQGCDDQRFG